MPTDTPNKDNKFDAMLAAALKSHCEMVPPDFTPKVLTQIAQQQQLAVLNQVIRRERLALAGCLGSVLAAAIAFLTFPDSLAAFFKNVVAAMTGHTDALLGRIPQTVQLVGGNWQFYAIFAVVLAFVLYGFLDLLLGDRLRIA